MPSYSFTVTYSDDSAVVAATIGTPDVTVTGPGGALAVTSGTALDPNGSPLTATYTATPLGGAWDSGDNGSYTISAVGSQVGGAGTYTIAVVGSQVLDTLGASVAANASLTTFDVDPNCIIQESFEGMTAPLFSNTGLIGSTDQFHASADDFWTATDGTTPAISTASTPYSGQDGNRYWAGEDLDHLDDNTDTVEFGPIPVSGFTGLEFSGLFAADGEPSAGSYRYDTGEGLEVAWSIDGSSFVDAPAFKASGPSNTSILEDTDLDGTGDGAQLTPTFASFGFGIPATGTSLTIRVTGISDMSSEEFAFDKLKVTGTSSGVNNPPVANPDDVDRHPTVSCKIPVGTLLANDSDPDGNVPLTITAVNYTGGNGANVFLSGGIVFYDPRGYQGDDTLEYTVEDSLGAVSTGTVTIHAVQDDQLTFNITSVAMSGGTATITGVGIPGRAYRVQYSDVMPVVSWSTLTTVSADALGQTSYSDPGPLPATRFYRVIHP